MQLPAESLCAPIVAPEVAYGHALCHGAAPSFQEATFAEGSLQDRHSQSARVLTLAEVAQPLLSQD